METTKSRGKIVHIGLPDPPYTDREDLMVRSIKQLQHDVEHWKEMAHIEIGGPSEKQRAAE